MVQMRLETTLYPARRLEFVRTTVMLVEYNKKG